MDTIHWNGHVIVSVKRWQEWSKVACVRLQGRVLLQCWHTDSNCSGKTSFTLTLEIGASMCSGYMLQASASSGSLSSAGGQSATGGTDYLKSALEASAAQKDTFFQRKIEVGHRMHTLHSSRALCPIVSVLQG